MRYNYEKLKIFGTQVMIQAGLEPDEAALFTENLLYADSRGMGSHGISRLINYSKRVKCGVITPGANAEIVQEAPSVLVIDGHNGVGAKIARQAMDLCVERAKTTGCCAATISSIAPSTVFSSSASGCHVRLYAAPSIHFATSLS